MVIRNSFRTRPALWVFSLLFLLYLASIISAGNVGEWWSLTHMKIPFLVLPLCFALLKPFSRKDYQMVMLSLVVMAVWSSIWVQVAYFKDYELFSRSLGYGAALPTPTNHVRYSILISSAMIVCLWMAIANIRYRFAWERGIYMVLVVYLFSFLHILSVRSGLALGYAGILALSLFYLRRITGWLQLLVVIVLAAAPIIAYKTLAGFRQKVHYALHDLRKYREDPTQLYSDAERWRSNAVGLEVGNQHPFFGAGTGRFRGELQAAYQAKFHLDTWYRPHNQWINVFALFGLAGLTLFLFILLYPMRLPGFCEPPIVPTLYGMQLLSMLMEHPLDTAVGTSMFLLLTLMGLSHYYALREKPGNIPQSLDP